MQAMATSGAAGKGLGGLGKWWGVLSGLLLIAAWINHAAGQIVVIVLSAVTTAWCFFRAPVTCGAPVRGRDDGCRTVSTAGRGLRCWSSDASYAPSARACSRTARPSSSRSQA